MISALKRTLGFFRFCPNCDHGIRKPRNAADTIICPRCGTPIPNSPETTTVKNDWSRAVTIALATSLASMLMLCGIVAVLYCTNKPFAMELRNLRQPRPNQFYFAIDVSQTIRPDILSDFKACILSRLRAFIGDEMVRYGVFLFGLPGCGTHAMRTALDLQSPADEATFSKRVAAGLDRVRIAFRGSQHKHLPLTTPLYPFLEKKLDALSGERIVILSDLVNDVAGCSMNTVFPAEALRRFGQNKRGQLIFFYPPPYLPGPYYSQRRMEALLAAQQEFIASVQKLTAKGELRAFFFPVPEDPLRSFPFFSKQLQTAVPATTYDIIRARLARLLQTLVGAVRG
jgi:hypothetical protein